MAKLIDTKYLDYAKSILINHFNFDNKIKHNMNKNSFILSVDALSSHSSDGALMMAMPGAITIDESFAVINDKGKFKGFKEIYRDLVNVELAHELLHSASRNNNYFGINRIDSATNRVGLNEGITQMFAEDACGVVESKYTNGYSVIKNITKIMRLCIGNDAFYNSYFKHSNDLEIECKKLTNSEEFYDEINKKLTDMYILVSCISYDFNYNNMVKKIYASNMKVCIDLLIYNLILPKYNTLGVDEKKKFIQSVIELSNDDMFFHNYLIDALKTKLNMNEEEKQTEKSKTNRTSKISEVYASAVFEAESNKSHISVDNDGVISVIDKKTKKVIRLPYDEKLYEYFYSIIYNNRFKNMSKTIDIEKFFSKDNKDRTFRFPKGLSLKDKKIYLSEFKRMASEKNIRVLNSIEDIDEKDYVEIESIHDVISFNELKTLLINYDLKKSLNTLGYYVARDRRTGKVVHDNTLLNQIKLANIWYKTSEKLTDGEELPGIEDAFSPSKKALFLEIIKILVKNVKRTGNIDIEELLLEENPKLNKAIKILLKDPDSYECMYEFIWGNLSTSPLQYVKEKSYSEIVNYNYSREINEREAEAVIRR